MKLKKNFQKPSSSHYFESTLRIKKKKITYGGVLKSRQMDDRGPARGHPDHATSHVAPTPEKSVLRLGSQHSRYTLR